jgi:drug/metabolite transporter (DMT)-like permease
MLLGVYVSGAIVALLINVFVGQLWTMGALTGLIMGLFSFASNAAFYKGFSVGKASLVAIFSALAPIVVTAGAYVLWHETFNFEQTIAFLVIIAGIVLIRYSSDLSLRNLQGVQWALLAMLFFGFTDLTTKQSTIWHGQTLPTLAVMYVTGATLFAIWAFRDGRVERSLRAAQAVGAASVAETAAGLSTHPAGEADAASESNRAGTTSMATLTATEIGTATLVGITTESASLTGTETAAGAASVQRWSFRRTFLWGLVVGLSNISGMMLILPAFRDGVTGLVSALIAMNVLIILLYARIFLKEKFSRQELIGMTLALAGMAILKLTA